MSHSMCPSATYAAATADALAASRAAVRRSLEGAAALRASVVRLDAAVAGRDRALDRLARARAARRAAEAL